MKKIMLLALACALLVLGAACTDHGAGSDGQGELQSGELIVNENENALHFAILNFDTFTPLLTGSQTVADCLSMIYEPLFDIDEQLNPIPVLAESCTLSEDALRVTVQLKPDVKWHDGTAFSAGDVVYTFDKIKETENNYSQDLADMEAAAAVDGNTVQFTFSKPIPDYTALLTFPILKNGTAVDAADFIPVGTGPYMYAGDTQTDQVILAANENWHGGEAAIQTVVLNEMKDREAAAYAFEANEIDVITSRTMDMNRSAPRGSYYNYDYVSNILGFVGYNHEEFENASVRKAVSYAINKQDIIENELYSRAVGVDVPLNPSAWFAPKMDNAVHDSAEIERLMAEDAWEKQEDGYFYREEDGGTQQFTLELLVNGENDEKLRIARRIAGQLNNAGFLTRVREEEFSDYQEAVSGGDYELFLGEVLLGKNADPAFLMAPGNFFNYSNPELDEALSRTGTAATHEEEQAAYGDYTRIFQYEMPFVPLFFRMESVLYEQRISGNKMPTAVNVYRSVDSWYFSQTDKK